MTDLDTLGYPEHLYRLRGYISSLDNSVVQAAWVNRAQEILDELFAQHSALVEHARTLERRADRYEKALAAAAQIDELVLDLEQELPISMRMQVYTVGAMARAALAWEDAP